MWRGAKNVQELREAIVRAKREFDECVQAAKEEEGALDKEPAKRAREYAQAELARIVDAAKQTEEETALAGLLKQAQAASRFRAYVIPEGDLAAEGQACLREIAQWDVPAPVLADLAKLLPDPKGGELAYRRALQRLYDESDYWDDYTDRFDQWTFWYAVALLIMGVLGMCGAAMLVYFRQRAWGFLAASFVGASISILLKLPSPMIYGEWVKLGQKFLARLATGFLGGLFGLAVIMTGLVNLHGLGFPDFGAPEADVRDAVSVGAPAKETVGGQPGEPQAQSQAQEPRSEPSAGGPPGEPGVPQPELGSGKEPLAPAARAQQRPSKTTARDPREKSKDGRHPCEKEPSEKEVILLLAFGTILGFSERAFGAMAGTLEKAVIKE